MNKLFSTKSIRNSQSNFVKARYITVINLFICAFLAMALAACSALSGRETAGEYIDDATITGSVKAALINEPTLKAHQIHVETFKNQVQLSGFVDTATEVSTAERIAKNVNGVQGVKNSIVINKKRKNKVSRVR